MSLLRRQALFGSNSDGGSGFGAGIGVGEGLGNQGFGIDDLFQNVLDVRHPGRSFRMENLKKNPLLRLFFPQKQKVYQRGQDEWKRR